MFPVAAAPAHLQAKTEAEPVDGETAHSAVAPCEVQADRAIGCVLPAQLNLEDGVVPDRECVGRCTISGLGFTVSASW